jgi:signal transduction histidine kinase/ligand-binding sensor domain-containing protein
MPLLIGLVWCTLACALGLDAPLQLLNHREYTLLDGAPSSVATLAQTSDGTLWLGGSTGLSRFDGVRFVGYPAPSEDPLLSNDISALAATRDGGLWIGYVRGGATFLKDGRAVNYLQPEGFPLGTTLNFAWDSQGFIWAATATALARLNGERWEAYNSAIFRASVRGFLIDREGTQWVANSTSLLARPGGETQFREIVRRPFDLGYRTTLAEAPNGEIWATAERGLIRIEHPRELQGGNVVTPRGSVGRTMTQIAFDRQGNLWASDGALLRVPFRELARADPGDVERFAPSERVSHNEVSSILQDREGNVWVSTANGLDRFSPGNVVRYPVNCPLGVFAPGTAGALWIACLRAHETTESHDGAMLSRHDTPVFTASYRDAGGTVWFAGPNVLAHIEDGRFIVEPLPPQVGDAGVQALVRDADGGVWVSTVPSVVRLHKGVWSEYGGLDALPRRVALATTVASDGTLWFGYRDGRLARIKDKTVRLFDAHDGLDVGGVLSIRAQGDEVLVGGEHGLAWFDGARFVLIKSSLDTSLRGISGIVRAQNGDLWLNGIAGISRIERHSVEDAIRDPMHRAQLETFDYLDGVPGAAPQSRPNPSAIEGTDGRIWFATTAGIVSIDARIRVARNTLPPPVTIWALTAGEHRYRNAGDNIMLPVHTDRLQIEYSAGSLTVPERVRFRYRLEGLDREWQDGGTRREASYTNLGPGNFRFRVIASNNDGVWNETGSSVAFTIAPAYYQTRWFYALCGLAILLALFALYRLRLRQVSAQIRGRLEARLAERERIARELHDTLLQGIQGLILRFQAATDRIPSNEPARELMEKSLDRADKLLAESRDKVKDLRPSPSDVKTLEQALAIEGAHFAEFQPAEFRISVQGAIQDLHPLVHEEGFLIGREALSNAFQHSRAVNIEVEVTYGDDALQVRIRDDGEGIASDMLVAGGRPGHFGLIGMRERANKLGAHLEVWSKPGAGTEVNLRVPAEVAYKRSQTAPRGGRWWQAVLRSSGQQH